MSMAYVVILNQNFYTINIRSEFTLCEFNLLLNVFIIKHRNKNNNLEVNGTVLAFVGFSLICFLSTQTNTPSFCLLKLNEVNCPQTK